MSAWLEHVKATMKLHPGKHLKDVLKVAKSTYKKTSDVVKYAVKGKKARTQRKSRRHMKKSQKNKKRVVRKSRRSRK